MNVHLSAKLCSAETAADQPLVPIRLSGEPLVALFTFTPLLSSPVIFGTVTRDRAIATLKHSRNVLIQSPIALSY